MENTQNTVLLVMDMQAAIVSMLPADHTVTGKVVAAIDKARTNNIPVIYVVVGFRKGTPEIGANNKGFSAAKERFETADPAAFMTLAPQLLPREDEPIVVKRRVSAFSGSDLEVILRAQGVQHIVLTGIATSGVVLSTTREASDKDYRITILSDACADMDDEVHRVLTTKVFPRQADVLTVDEWK